jgi:alkylhydroperoxidase family enzyme
MILTEPRLVPLAEEQLNDETRRILERARMGGRVMNIFRTLAHHPKLLERWMVYGTHVLNKSTLPARAREMLILRIGWLCRSEYEWGQHVLIGQAAGLTDEEIERIKAGPDDAGWSEQEASLLRAVDELRADAFISDPTWLALSDHFNRQQLLDLIFTVGQYNLVSMALNSLGVQLDEGVPGFNR